MITGASLLASIVAVSLAKHVAIQVILIIVTAVILASGSVFLIITKTKKMDQIALQRETDMKLLTINKEQESVTVVQLESAEVQPYPSPNP